MQTRHEARRCVRFAGKITRRITYIRFRDPVFIIIIINDTYMLSRMERHATTQTLCRLMLCAACFFHQVKWILLLRTVSKQKRKPAVDYRFIINRLKTRVCCRAQHNMPYDVSGALRFVIYNCNFNLLIVILWYNKYHLFREGICEYIAFVESAIFFVIGTRR